MAEEEANSAFSGLSRSESTRQLDQLVNMAKEHYGSKLLVIRDQGEFSYVLKLRLHPLVAVNVIIPGWPVISQLLLYNIDYFNSSITARATAKIGWLKSMD